MGNLYKDDKNIPKHEAIRDPNRNNQVRPEDMQREKSSPKKVAGHDEQKHFKQNPPQGGPFERHK